MNCCFGMEGMGGWMMAGMILGAILVIALLVAGLAALIKYLRTGPKPPQVP